jgi:hypothetical protein
MVKDASPEAGTKGDEDDGGAAVLLRNGRRSTA